MSDNKTFRCNFNVEGNIPKLAFETFALAQAKLTGVRIWLEENAEGRIQGFLEGNRETIEKMRLILMKSYETLGNISKVLFSEMKELKHYTEQTLANNSSDSKALVKKNDN